MPICAPSIYSCRRFIPCSSLLLLTLLFVILPCGVSAAGIGREPVLVSLAVSSQDIKTVLADLADMAGVDIIVDDTLSARITLRLSDVPFEQALQLAARAAGATASCEDGLYLVTGNRGYYSPTAQPEQSSVRVFDLVGSDFLSALALIRVVAKDLVVEPFEELECVVVRGPYSSVNAIGTSLDSYFRSQTASQAQPRTLEVRKLSYADASEVSMSMQGQVPSVRVTPMRNTNAVIVNGPPDDAELVLSAIAQLDRAPALIAFDVEVVEVDSEALRDIGLDWTNSYGQPTFSLTFREDPPQSSSGNDVPDGLSFRPWTRASLEVAAQVRAMERDGSAKVLARPSITTLEHKTAKIVTGDRYTIVINQTGSSGWQQTQYIDAGVRLELTPRLDADGAIVVAMTPQVSAVTGFSREGYPVLSTREVTTAVRLKDGESLVIGGLMRTESSTEQRGLPVLARIPLLGSLFGSDKANTRTTELIILVTPRIVGSAQLQSEGDSENVQQ